MFEGEQPNPMQAILRASITEQQYHKYDSSQHATNIMGNAHKADITRYAPPPNWVKYNVDAAYNNHCRAATVAIVARDSNGTPIAGTMKEIPIASALIAEAQQLEKRYMGMYINYAASSCHLGAKTSKSIAREIAKEKLAIQWQNWRYVNIPEKALLVKAQGIGASRWRANKSKPSESSWGIGVTSTEQGRQPNR
ncbi:hypothetical protein PIB30_043821 [Stylosanthes scabra]|uniref:RNase H type-1 domain-containing protein n=1 Tax=Stylosanthes scabra TaxID=79078 RepID=A0ABU6VGP6_9FABA|nr:hypothetical protein [Stylosanthes scabra]